MGVSVLVSDMNMTPRKCPCCLDHYLSQDSKLFGEGPKNAYQSLRHRISTLVSVLMMTKLSQNF